MEQTISAIPLTKLALAFIPVFMVLAIFTKWSMPTKRSLHAVLRMLVQLLLVGYVLSYIFLSQNTLVIGLLLLVMIFASSYIALSNLDLDNIELTQSEFTHRKISKHNIFCIAFIAIFCSSLIVLLFMTRGVLNLQPWYQAQTLVPLAGMVFASGMNSVSLCGERFYAELKHEQPYEQARNIAFKASMIPNINALLAVGIVSIPGMMTGQILAGVSPFIAARYQIMVMCMVFASAGLASAIFLSLHKLSHNR